MPVLICFQFFDVFKTRRLDLRTKRIDIAPVQFPKLVMWLEEPIGSLK